MDLIGGLFRQPERMWFEGSSGRTGTFDAITLSEGKRIPVIGTRLSRDGLAFVSDVAVRGGEVPVTFTIRRRAIPSRVKILKYEPTRTAKRLMHRYFCAFTALSEDDRAAVLRYVDDLPEPAAAPGSAASPVPAGTFSFTVQGTIADHLVRMKRLAPPGPGMAPLIRLDAEVPRKLEDGRTARDVVVHSRVRTDTGVRGYETRFRVFADEQVEVLS